MIKEQPIKTLFSTAITSSILVCLMILLTSCDAETNEPVDSQRHSHQWIQAAALSSDGTRAIVSQTPHVATLWDLSNNAILLYLNHSPLKSQGIRHIMLSHQGDYSLVTTDHHLIFWNLHTGQPLGIHHLGHKIVAVDLEKNGSRALIALDNHTILYMNMMNGQVIWRWSHNGDIKDVNLSQDGQYAVTGADDRSVKLWDTNTGQMLHQWDHEKSVSTVAISPHSRFVVSTDNYRYLYVWDLMTGKRIHALAIPPMNVSGVVFSPDERYLAISCTPQILQLWHMDSGALKKQWILPKIKFWKPTSIKVHDMVFTPNNRYLLTEDSLGFHHKWLTH